MHSMTSWRLVAGFSIVALSLTSCNNPAKAGDIEKQATKSAVLINYTNKPGQSTEFIKTPRIQQQSTAGANSQAGDAVGTFKRGMPINVYAQSETAQKAEDFFNQGNDYFVKQNYQQALVSYERAIAIKPDFAEAWTGRGIALEGLKRHSEALASHEKALAIKPDYADAWINRGVALARLKRYSEALASFDKALAIKPDYADAWYNRGIALGELKRYLEALASYEKAIAIKPDDADAWNGRGAALSYLKRYEEALKSYDKAISINPNYQLAINNRKEVLKQLGR